MKFTVLGSLTYNRFIDAWDEENTRKTNASYITPDRRQSKTLILSTDVDQNSCETVFDCHLSPDWRQMAIENTVSSDFRSAFVDC